MSLTLIPDAAALVSGWLREHPEITGMGARVAGTTPSAMTHPWIRVTMLDATDSGSSGTEHLIEYPLQLDCYAGNTAMQAFAGQAEASLLARRARAILHGLRGTQDDGVVVTSVRFGGHFRSPDTTYEPARERVIVTAYVWMHAVLA